MELLPFLQHLLRLPAPFHITTVEHDQVYDVVTAIHIHIGVEATYRPADTVAVEGHETRAWRHLNLFQYPCFLHCAVPRYRYADGHTRLMDVPWAPAGLDMTRDLDHVLLAAEEAWAAQRQTL